MPSTRNSVEAHLHLLDALECSIFFLPEGPPPVLDVVKHIAQRRPLRTFQVAGLSELLDGDSVNHYAYTKGFDSAKDDPLVAVHTSGSTGMPKPIVLTHRFATALDAMLKIPLLSGNPTHFHYWQGLRCFMPFPLFHSGGLSGLIISIYASMNFVFPPPGPLTSHLADAVFRNIDVQLTILPSAILAEIAQEPEYLEKLTKIPYVYFGAGPLPPAIGDLIASKSRLLGGFGSTEVGTFPVEMHSAKDWRYLKFSPFLGYEMRRYHDDLYELYIVKDPRLEDFQPVFSTFRDISVYRTKDLFSRHPSKLDLWLSRGRSDDIIVYSTGEKMNPTSFEGIVNGHTAVKSVLVYGEGRFQSSLIVEAKNPPTTEPERRYLMDLIWPSIQQANSISPAFGKVMPEMVLFTTPGRPLPRSPKGTVQRKLAYDSYQVDLEELYSLRIADVPYVNGNSRPVEQSRRLSQMILEIISSFQGFENVDSRTSLFDSGFDSLQVLTLNSRVKKCMQQLGLSLDTVSSKTIYASPDVETLTSKLLSAEESRASPTMKMQDFLDTHILELPLTARTPSRHFGRHSVILTGSTGSLGSYLLDELLRDDSVGTVFCLNRKHDCENYQKRWMFARGLSFDFGVKCVKFLQVDLSKPYLGLSMADYSTLLREVTFVIHNAWAVDFNQSLDHLASTHIRGVKQLVDFSSRSAYGAFLFFISSGSTVTRWNHKFKRATEIPEQVCEDWDAAEPTGYSRAKLISERTIAAASVHANVPAAICRLGQIAGPMGRAGQWPKQEWLPSILASSKHIGKLPSSLAALDVVDWVPVDVMAPTILHLAKSSLYYTPAGSPAIYHVVNPRKTSWSTLLPAVEEHLGLETVSPSEWLELLRESSDNGSDVEHNAALKLMDFMEDMFSDTERRPSIPLSVKNTVKACPSLAHLGPIDQDLMRLWLEQWAF